MVKSTDLPICLFSKMTAEQKSLFLVSIKVLFSFHWASLFLNRTVRGGSLVPTDLGRGSGMWLKPSFTAWVHECALCCQGKCDFWFFVGNVNKSDYHCQLEDLKNRWRVMRVWFHNLSRLRIAVCFHAEAKPSNHVCSVIFYSIGALTE